MLSRGIVSLLCQVSKLELPSLMATGRFAKASFSSLFSHVSTPQPPSLIEEHEHSEHIKSMMDYRKELELLKTKQLHRYNNRRTKVGIVTSTKMDKSVVVTCYHKMEHPKYRIFIKRKSKIMAHDEHGMCSEGDVVRIAACRPISLRKRHSVMEIIKKMPEF